KWGYYVLPILFGDRFVGRFEPRIDRAAGTLRILGLWWEYGFDPRTAEGFVAAMRRALAAYLRFGGVRSVEWAPARAAVPARGPRWRPRPRRPCTAGVGRAAARCARRVRPVGRRGWRG